MIIVSHLQKSVLEAMSTQLNAERIMCDVLQFIFLVCCSFHFWLNSPRYIPRHVRSLLSWVLVFSIIHNCHHQLQKTLAHRFWERDSQPQVCTLVSGLSCSILLSPQFNAWKKKFQTVSLLTSCSPCRSHWGLLLLPVPLILPHSPMDSSVFVGSLICPHPLLSNYLKW